MELPLLVQAAAEYGGASSSEAVRLVTRATGSALDFVAENVWVIAALVLGVFLFLKLIFEE